MDVAQSYSTRRRKMPAVSKMENPRKFRILGLPYVALKEVLKFMNPFELINFSLTNLKSKEITKFFTNSVGKELDLYVGLHNEPRLEISRFLSFYCYKMTSDIWKSDTFDTYRIQENRLCRKYSDNILDGFMKWSEYVTQVLNFKYSAFGLNLDDFAHENQSIIDWLKANFKKVLACTIEGKDESDNIVSQILEHFEITSSLSVFAPLSTNFSSKLPQVSHCVFIEHSEWVTLQQIFDLDSERIIMKRSTLSNRELIEFVTSWMAMKTNLRLQEFRASIQAENGFQVILNGLPDDKVHRGLTPEALIRFKIYRPFDGAWTVYRNDGTQAVLRTCTRGDSLTFYVTVV